MPRGMGIGVETNQAPEGRKKPAGGFLRSQVAYFLREIICRPCRGLVCFVYLTHGWRRGLRSAATPWLSNDALDYQKPLVDSRVADAGGGIERAGTILRRGAPSEGSPRRQLWVNS